MSAFRRRKGNSPRLAPELDDVVLGRVRRRLDISWARGELDTTVIALMEKVIQDAGQDWDRKAHRLGVLAEAAGRALPQIWLRQAPQDPGALLLHAWSEVTHARAQGTHVDLSSVREACLRAAELIPADPTPWTVLLAAMRCEREPYGEVGPVWREIKTRDPWNREAHLQALGYLSPDECGSTGQVLDLLDGIRSVMPARAPTVGLEVTAFVHAYQRAVAAGGMAALNAGDYWRRPDASAALSRAARDWPLPGFLGHAAALADLNVLAYALVKAALMDEAVVVLRATAGMATPWPWNAEGDPFERFSYWHGATSRTRPATSRR
ncbi:hypothetical protein OG889_36730 [Streptomyces sp. NBC_00481]|uniref:hypothetical protein n=1 Tax=unclassified Streptomyces TaxID=2593676 RepID=UPI002DD9D509|nr:MULTISPECIES: hypothetical protein [unclassified Streptomyces]WRY99765.1 hypothetical protein OG889_36730 [Streptomyces sp. NBC_00481]